MHEAGMDLDDEVVVTAVVGAEGTSTESGDSGDEGGRGGDRAAKRTRVVGAQGTSVALAVEVPVQALVVEVPVQGASDPGVEVRKASLAAARGRAAGEARKWSATNVNLGERFVLQPKARTMDSEHVGDYQALEAYWRLS